MLLHVLGVGAVGSLVSAQLSRCTGHTIRLVVRNRGLYDTVSDSLNITIERNGVYMHADRLETELLHYRRDFPYGHPQASEDRHDAFQEAERRLQSMGPISSLFVTTKAPQVLPAIQQLLPRLSKTSTIVLLQNGAGLVETLVQNLFQDEKMRPNFVIGVNSHGAWVKDWGKGGGVSDRPGRTLHTVWAGVGSIPFGVLPNYHARKEIQAVTTKPSSNPIYDPLSREHPNLSHIPLTRYTESLHASVSALLTATPLNASWLPLSELLTIQLQKVAVNCIINPITSIYDIQNGAIVKNEHMEQVAYRIAQEASAVFAAQMAKSIQAHHRPSANTSQTMAEINAEVVEDSSPLTPRGDFQLGHPLHPLMLLDKAMTVAKMTSLNISSTLQDVRAGKSQTEIDYMNGYISRLGAEYGIPTPLNDSMVDLVKFKLDCAKNASKDYDYRQKHRKVRSDRYGEVYLRKGVPLRRNNSI